MSQSRDSTSVANGPLIVGGIVSSVVGGVFMLLGFLFGPCCCLGVVMVPAGIVILILGLVLEPRPVPPYPGAPMPGFVPQHNPFSQQTQYMPPGQMQMQGPTYVPQAPQAPPPPQPRQPSQDDDPFSPRL